MGYRAAQKDEKKKVGFIEKSAALVILILAVKIVRPSYIPFDLFHFWNIKGSIEDAIADSTLLFAWGAGVTTLIAILTYNKPVENRYAEKKFGEGILISAYAGIFEEICFRWILFYAAMVILPIVNWLFFGWAGFGAAEWVFTTFFRPVADFFTLTYLHDILYSPYGWVVGAAVISANGEFRDGHIYQGVIGWTNSWFCGMFFFWLMFTHGLLAAIVVHFLYDLFIFAVVYIDSVIERARGLA